MARYVVSQLGRFLLLMVAVAVVTFALVSLSPVDPSAGQRGAGGAHVHERGEAGGSWRPTGEPTRPCSSAFSLGPATFCMAIWGCRCATTRRWPRSSPRGRPTRSPSWGWRGSPPACSVSSWAWRRPCARGGCSIASCAATASFWPPRRRFGWGCCCSWCSPCGSGWFPLGFSVPVGVAAADVTFADALHHMALPAITLSVVGVANVALHTRAKAIDVLNSDYVRFARARGLSAARGAHPPRPAQSGAPGHHAPVLPDRRDLRRLGARGRGVQLSRSRPGRRHGRPRGRRGPARRHRTCVGGARVRGEPGREPHLRPGGSLRYARRSPSAGRGGR